jgi:hypothetical protein
VKQIELELSWDSGARRMQVSLDGALEDLMTDQPHLAKLIVEKLVEVALEGKPLTALKAIELLFARVDGPVVQKHQITNVPMQRVLLSSPAAAEGLAAARMGLLAVKSELSGGDEAA